MKRIIKWLFLFGLFVFSLTIIYPTNAKALSQQTSYINIYDTTEFIVGDLSFSNITFKDYSSSSTLSFGLTGIIENSSNEEINYTSTAYYYDLNYNLIAQGYNFGTAVSGTNYFNQMYNLNILNGHSINEVYFYRLSITTSNNLSTETTISTTPSKNNQYKNFEYVIDKYDVNIIVKENNTLDITETITAYFNVPKHGIYRTIPLKNTIVRLDGTTSKNRTQITNLSVDNNYTTSKEYGNYKIKIGSANYTLTGKQTYEIKYTYNLGKDPIKNYDELYYNIIGNEWDTVIGNVTFKVTMPKEFDSSKLGFSSGKTGSTNNSKVKYNVTGNTITGSYEGILGVGEALTIRCELDEGYFVGAGLPINIIDYLILLVPITFLGISLFFWYKFGRDEQVVETVEFYPPEGFNSLEVGFLYKGEANNQDVISLLIYLANKGYIKISETFKITKLKEYDGDNINEKLFLDGLFTKQQSKIFSKKTETPNNSLNEVTFLDLYDNFYITTRKILSNVNTKENKNKIFERKASNKLVFVQLMIIVTYALITFPPILNYGNLDLLFFALFFPGIGFSVMFNIWFDKNMKSSLFVKILALFWGGLFGGIPWAFIVLPTLLQEPIYLIGYIIGILCVLGMIISLKYLPKRTKYGNEIYGKLRGFKNFLETAEKDRLETMVMQEPTYFYDILPFTYVLGVSDTWIKKFEAITLQAPTWYDGQNDFNMTNFETFMNSTMSSAQSVMSSNSSNSGDGSSGGGSSGGGSGGGGGGSW